MFIVTNRSIRENAVGTDLFGPITSGAGSQDLRIVRVERNSGKKKKGWKIEVIPDELTPELKKEVKRLKGDAGVQNGETLYASHYATACVLHEAKAKKKNILLFVHGFNNDINAVLTRAHELENNYDVMVVCFSWPALGGGIQGTLNYRNDKLTAQNSVPAFVRFLLRARLHVDRLNRGAAERCKLLAAQKYPADVEKQYAWFEELMEKECPVRINMMLHSMGNYLYKRCLQSSTSNGIGILFDNVTMVAADTNNEGHAEWVERIQARGSVYIVINENDRALTASQVKTGESQKLRLGSTRRRLNSQLAIYIDATGAPNVGSGHAYFEGRAVSAKAAPLRTFFRKALNGEQAEDHLEFDSGIGAYRVPQRQPAPKRPRATRR